MPELKRLAEMSPQDLEKKYGIQMEKASLAKSNGKFLLTVAGKQQELDPRYVVSHVPLDEIIQTGSEIKVIRTGGVIVVIVVVIPHWPGCYHILCYLPAPDLHAHIDLDLRVSLLEKLSKEKVIPAALGEQLIQEIKASTGLPR